MFPATVAYFNHIRLSTVIMRSDDKKHLLDYAVYSIGTVAGAAMERPESTPAFSDTDYNGAFVTVYVDGALRGCIGYLSAVEPLGEAVYNLARKAATEDNRFLPIQKQELSALDVEITILHPMEPITGPSEIIIGTHGIYLERGYNRGILLPQVASERHWDAHQFLNALCDKAALPRSAWKSPQSILKRFSVDIIDGGSLPSAQCSQNNPRTSP